MASITINGRTYSGAGSVSINDGVVVIDGVVQREAVSGVVEVHVEGVLGALHCDASVRCGEVQGSINAGGSIAAGNVGGNVQAGGSVGCGTVGGSVSAGGSIRHG